MNLTNFTSFVLKNPITAVRLMKSAYLTTVGNIKNPHLVIDSKINELSSKLNIPNISKENSKMIKNEIKELMAARAALDKANLENKVELKYDVIYVNPDWEELTTNPDRVRGYHCTRSELLKEIAEKTPDGVIPDRDDPLGNNSDNAAAFYFFSGQVPKSADPSSWSQEVQDKMKQAAEYVGFPFIALLATEPSKDPNKLMQFDEGSGGGHSYIPKGTKVHLAMFVKIENLEEWKEEQKRIIALTDELAAKNSVISQLTEFRKNFPLDLEKVIKAQNEVLQTESTEPGKLGLDLEEMKINKNKPKSPLGDE